VTAIATIAAQAAESGIAIAAGTAIAPRHGSAVRVGDRSIDGGSIATLSAATAASCALAIATDATGAAATADDYDGIGCRRGYDRTMRTATATAAAAAIPTIG
jgi:hypothetical protein